MLARAMRDELRQQRDMVVTTLGAAVGRGARLASVSWLGGPMGTARLAFDDGMEVRAGKVHLPAVDDLDLALDGGPLWLTRAEHPGPFFALYFGRDEVALPLLAGELRILRHWVGAS